MFEYLSILCLSSGEHLVEKRSACFRSLWGWTRYGNQYFHFFPNQLTWAQAQRHCQSLNANLASVCNLGEYQAIQRVILSGARSHVPTWIGGSDAQEERYWFWIDGTRFTYANWCHGEPNNVGGRENCLCKIHQSLGRPWLRRLGSASVTGRSPV
uniref:Ladderlectin-like n=1 Tax=Pundamilia nyererei TaxID=303518 RepID=A0A3B4F0P3_9CICH